MPSKASHSVNWGGYKQEGCNHFQTCVVFVVCNTIDTNQVNILDHLDGMIIPFTNFQNFNYRIA